MDKWLIILVSLAFTGIAIYGINSWVGLVNQDQQLRNEQIQLRNQEFIKQQISDEFDELDAKRAAASNKTWTLIVETEGNILNNLTDHRVIANLTYDRLFAQDKLLLENFKKVFKAFNITD